MRFIFIAVLAVTPFLCISQATILLPVHMHWERHKNPFSPVQYISTISKDSFELKGVPSNMREYRIKKIRWNKDLPLYIFYGKDSAGHAEVIFDANFNHSFVGDKVIQLDQADSKKAVVSGTLLADTAAEVAIHEPNGEEVIVKFTRKSNFSHSDPEEMKWMLLIYTENFKTGQFLLNGNSYRVALYGGPNIDYQHNLSSFLAAKLNEEYSSFDITMPYELKEPVYLGKAEVSMDSISLLADTVWIRIINHPVVVQGHRVNEHAADFLSTDLRGQLFSMKSQEGKYVLMDFWGTWCAPCIAMMPDLRKMSERYKTRKNFVMVSIASDRRAEQPKMDSIVAAEKMNWIQLPDWTDQPHTIVNTYYVRGFPTTILIDPKGKIIYRSTGNDKVAQLEKILEKELGRH